ncbi:MAG TPA: hypothetical protein PLU17_11430, partial [Chitinophagaceae bacterium]|nr:hypothetical protein [Chitinophagaceae bacterium]
MLRLSILTSLLFFNTLLFAQDIKKINTGKFTGPFTLPLSSSTSRDDIGKPSWDILFQSLPNEEIEHLFHTEELKKIKMAQKLKSISSGTSSNKTAGAAPTIGVNFKGNELKSWTPTDNSIAVSNGGQIVSCVNYGIEYYDTTGGAFIVSQTWNAFVNDTTLKSGKFDPRVLYDKLHDRFILVLLHGFSSTKSKILTFFSKTNNPLDGWYLYQLPGNPYNDTTWTDFPTIGVNNDELFINGNRFGDAPTYNWKETYIYQIGLTEGYAGLPLNYGLWNGIFTPDSLDGITLYPAANGLGDSMNEKMYFVQLMPDSGSHVYLYEINGLQSSATKTLTASQFAIPHYEVCANAFQKDPFTGFVDSLSTGSAWT